MRERLPAEICVVKGFSERNLKRMAQFYKEYPGLRAIGPQTVAQLISLETAECLVTTISWGHNILNSLTKAAV